MAALVPDYDIEPATEDYWAKTEKGVYAVAGTTCCLSIIGSVLIIFSYLFFKDLRTNARLILVHISLADFGVAACNLFGIAFKFERFLNVTLQPSHFKFTSTTVKHLCKAEAFIAHFSTLSSVLWTMALAAYMYAIIISKLNNSNNSDENKQGKWFVRISCVICYGLTIFVDVWMFCTGKLGYSPSYTSGWCGTILMHKPLEEKIKDYMSVFFGYDLWIILTMFFIIVIYLSLHFYVRNEKKNFQQYTYNVDYKFIAIPVAFVLLRVGTLVHNILGVYAANQNWSEGKKLHLIFKYIDGIGDSGQGAVNAVLFMIFTHSVRLKLLLCCCWCCLKGKMKAKEGQVNEQDSENADSTDDSDDLERSVPVRIAYRPQKDYMYGGHNMGSMASTTSNESSPSKYHDSLSGFKPRH